MIQPIFQSRPRRIVWQDFSCGCWLVSPAAGQRCQFLVIRLPTQGGEGVRAGEPAPRRSCLFYDLVSVVIHHLAVSSVRCCFSQRPALPQGGLSHTEVLVTGGRSHWQPPRRLAATPCDWLRTDRAWVLGSEKGVSMASWCSLGLRLVMCKEKEENTVIGKSPLTRSWSNKTCFRVSYIPTTRLLVFMSTALNRVFLQGLNT